MSHFITPPSPHWPGPHPTGFHTSRSTMSNPFFYVFFVSTHPLAFSLLPPNPFLCYCPPTFPSCLVFTSMFVHVHWRNSLWCLWTMDGQQIRLFTSWSEGRAAEACILWGLGAGGDLVWCSVWRLWLCVCVCIWYIFVWHRGRMFYIRFVLFTVWPYSKLCCQYAWMIEYSNSEAKFRFINTMIVSALKDLAVKAGVSLWTACVMLGSRRWSFTYCIFIHQGALSRCLKEMLKSFGAAKMLVAGSSFKKCRK